MVSPCLAFNLSPLLAPHDIPNLPMRVSCAASARVRPVDVARLGISPREFAIGPARLVRRNVVHFGYTTKTREAAPSTLPQP